jgi:hypothetical protein
MSSVVSQKVIGIRPAMHPGWRRCSSLEYRLVFSVVAPCQPGASPPSVHNDLLRRDTRNVWVQALAGCVSIALGLGAGVAAGSGQECGPEAVAALERAAADIDAADGETAAPALREAYTASPSCPALATAAWSWHAWLAAAQGRALGGSAEALAGVREALDVLEPGSRATTPDAAYAAAIAHAAAAAAQSERDEMRVWLEHAGGLARRLPPGHRPWPLPPAVAEGELWLAVQDPALADAAFTRALAERETPVALRGLARARASGGNMGGGCEPYRRALALVDSTRSGGSLAVEARAFLRLCP